MRIKSTLQKSFFTCCIFLLAFGGATSVSFAAGQVTTKSTVWYAPGLALQYEIDGALSKAVRTGNGVSIQFRTSELNAGDAYTLLVAIFNYPELCQGPFPAPIEPLPSCNALDLFQTPGVAGVIILLTGNVVGRSGHAAFAGHINIGDNTGSILAPLYAPSGSQPPGLVNPLGAEFHLVLVSHGPKLPEFMPDMIEAYLGGCENQPFPGFPNLPFPEWGERGPNYCTFEQEAFNLAPAEL